MCSRRFVHAISREPPVRITHDFVCWPVPTWPGEENIGLSFSDFNENRGDFLFFELF